jgi:hypothetical protein
LDYILNFMESITMTIRRQYSLPNCTLILDGLSDGSSSTGIADSRPLMSSLFNAECHFVGAKQPLLGGRDFLTSLVATVSNYAQEFLSGISHPLQPQKPDSLVSLVKGDGEHVHHLKATLENHSNPSSPTELSATGKPTEIKLSTVQLFDLLEAIDQFLADRRTLPDIMVPLQPVRKAIAQPISTHAAPAGLGLASLVVASLIGYALPSPQTVTAPTSINTAPVVAPKTAKPTTSPSTGEPAKPDASTSPSTGEPAKPAVSTSPSPTSNLPSKTGIITEATQIGFLQRKLQRDLSQNWQERDRIKQAANFQVKVNQDGKIVNYQVAGKTNPSQSNLTPLPKLSSKSTDANQAIGNFDVVFNPTGAIEIKPTATLQGEMSLGKQITEAKLKTTLAEQLKTTLKKSVASTKPLDAKNLNYRVAVTKTGEIVDYEPTNRRAAKAESKTPLPKLAKFNPQAAISQEPLAQYQVVFGSNGAILVTPR